MLSYVYTFFNLTQTLNILYLIDQLKNDTVISHKSFFNQNTISVIINDIGNQNKYHRNQNWFNANKHGDWVIKNVDSEIKKVSLWSK